MSSKITLGEGRKAKGRNKVVCQQNTVKNKASIEGPKLHSSHRTKATYVASHFLRTSL